MTVIRLNPNGVGTYYEWTDGTQYSTVADDNDYTYITKNAPSRNTFDIESPTVPQENRGAINSVTVYARVKIYGGIKCMFGRVFVTGGSYYQYLSEITNTSYEWKSTTLATNPKTGNAWTWNDLETLEIGVSIDVPATPITYVSKIYAEVDYNHLTPVGIGPQLIGLTW